MGLRTVINEAELLEGIVNGNEEAFAKLFYAYHNQLGEYVFMLTSSEQMTEEIVQDVFVKIWMNREMLLSIGKFTSYLFILTRNYTLNCIRQHVRERKLQDDYGKTLSLEDEEAEEGFSLLNDPDYQSLIERAIAQLPPQQQKVFMLRQQGMKNPEIARQMGISPDSVKKYQQWALKTIAEFVKVHAAFSLLFLLTKN